MSSMSDYLEGQIAAHIFRTASMSKPAALYIALYTAAPSDAGGGTECTGGGYARVACNPADANWSAPAGGNGQVSNVGVITFPAPTASWGRATHFAILDALTGGNLLFWAPLANSKLIETGDAVTFAAGALTVTFS